MGSQAEIDAAHIASLEASLKHTKAVGDWIAMASQELVRLSSMVGAIKLGLDALTEQVGDTTQYATLGDVDSLRAEMLSRTATPFDAA